MSSFAVRDLQRLRGVSFDVLRAQSPDLAARVAPLLRKISADRVLAGLNLSVEVKDKIGPIDLSEGTDGVIAQLQARLAALEIPREHIENLIKNARDIAARLGAEQISAIEPAIGREISLAHVQAVAKIAGLDTATATRFAGALVSLGVLDDDALDGLVKAKTIEDTQARAVAWAGSAYRLAGQDENLAEAIIGGKFAALSDKRAQSTEDLALLSTTDWTQFFAYNTAAIPENMTAEEAGETMSARLSAMHPSIALMARLPRVVTDQMTRQLAGISALMVRNPSVVGVDPDMLDLTGIEAEQVDAVRANQHALHQLSNSYPGLQLATVFDDANRKSDDKVATASRRIGYVQKVAIALKDNPLIDLDLSDDSDDISKLGLNQLDASADEKVLVLKTFRAYQRLSTVTETADELQALASHGFDSALSIGRQQYDLFEIKSGVPGMKARKIWTTARESLADTSLSIVSIVDVIGDLFGKMYVSNQPPVEAYLKKLAGFKDLFGNVSFCHCEECQSILGPAAYYVDLMKYIDENLRTQFAGHLNHPLDLKYRRPDLWTLELSCDNTNNRIPTLDIVNEVLENNIAKRAGFVGDFANRPAVTSLVYRNTLPLRRDSLMQPFHLPLTRITSYMAGLEASHASIAQAAAAATAAQIQAEFGISSDQRQIIATADLDIGRLGKIYGITFSGAPAAIANVDASVLAPALHLDRAGLVTLIATKFVQAAGVVKITATKLNADSVQNDVEWVSGLNANALDRMHRFLRLLLRTGWTDVELDSLLTAIGATNIDSPALETLAALHNLQPKLGITVFELCGLVGDVPTTTAGKSLFDRLFNPPTFVASDGTFPKPNAHFIHPAFRQNTAAPIDPAQPRLLTALNVDLDGLAALARHLAAHLAQDVAPSFDPAAANDADRYFVLSAPNLTLLYRHSRLARLLQVSIDDLFQMLGFLGYDMISGFTELRDVINFHAWRKQTPYTIDEVALAIGQPPRDTTRFPDPAAIAADLLTDIARALIFKDTIFAVALGMSEQASHDLVLANPGVMEAAAGGDWRLAGGIDLATIALVIPASATVPTPPSGSRAVTAPEIREALRPFLAAEVLVRSLGAKLNLDRTKISGLAALVNVSLTADPVVRAARGDGPIAPLVALVAALRPVTAALAPAIWDSAAIDFLRLNPAVFGTDPLPQTVATPLHPNVPFLSLAQLRTIATYSRIAARRTGPADDAPLVAPADLQAVLTGFAGGPFPAAVDAEMSRALVVPSGLVVGMRGHVTLPAIAAEALDQLDQAAQLALAIGIDGETLGALVSNDYVALSHAADALYAVLSARNPDETTRAAKLDLVEQPVREAKRDALGEYLIRSINPRPWSSLDDLYKYFLIDIDSGGCATTSRVVAATMSAQLYVHRAIMNLEQDDFVSTDPRHVTLKMPADAGAEWDWRQNYRVWQANRKVFLWPENYLEPDLRDDKTPLFKVLEQELLQTDISDQNVLDAYTKYLAGFEEVATVRIAGAWHDYKRSIGKRAKRSGSTNDVLHLFGATASDPPIYYYRTCENLVASGNDPNKAAIWSSWQKVTVQITGRRVAPVVHRGRLHVFWIDVKTRSMNTVKDGASAFSGYNHTMSLRFTTLRPDGTWTAPQTVELPADSNNFGPARGQIQDTVSRQTVISPGSGGEPTATTSDIIKYDPLKRDQPEAIDDYSVSGVNWDGVWVHPWSLNGEPQLELQFRNFVARTQVDLFDRRTYSILNPTVTDPPTPYPQLLCALKGGAMMPLYYGTPDWMAWPNPAYANAVIDERRLDVIEMDAAGLKPYLQDGLYHIQIASVPSTADLLAVPGNEVDGLIQSGNDILLMQGSAKSDGRYILRRLGTTLVREVARRLFEDGVDSLLDTSTQYALAEAGIPIALVAGRVDNRANTGKLDFGGPYGTYYRELFFQIPFLIANALNSRGRFAAAQHWYQYIFDPAATEVIDTTGVPAAEKAHRLFDRVWRYREFRGLNIEKLRDVLTDPAALALYKKDPFNPWAIARRRISAFQKTIVMRYVDNLLDWADSLFRQFTMESVNEALMLYIMAQDILGPRPVELGNCGNVGEHMNYEQIGPLVDGSSEILVEMETWILGYRVRKIRDSYVAPKSKYGAKYTAVDKAVRKYPLADVVAKPRPVDPDPIPSVTVPMSRSAAGHTATTARGTAATAAAVDLRDDAERVVDVADGDENLFTGLGWNDQRTASWAPAGATARVKSRDKVGGRKFEASSKKNFPEWIGRYGWHVIRQISPVFCFPANADLLAYWSRVEDRLYKIRHCMDIDGNVRELALFAPPIDPMQLVRMRAAGLSLEDVLGAGNGNLPPYRFLYLVDRAKAFAASMSGFGAALLGAMEKRDAEELNRLRLTQQMNISQLTTQLRRLEVDSAAESLEAVNRQYDAANYRSEFYAGLVSGDRSGWEIAESISRHAASTAYLTEAVIDGLAAIFAALPQIGSPFAMKYGGVELNTSLRRFGNATNAVAEGSTAVATSMSLEATYDRRAENWKHQKDLADFDVKSLARQVKSAEIRLDIANHSFDLHQKSIEQIQEMLDLTDGKFTNHGHYVWLSTQLQRIYRSAYQNAFALAKLAEQAYRFERGEDNAPRLSPSYWDQTHSGLLAGEGLLIDLQSLERRFLETNYRALELDQAFALSQIDPAALIALRQTGECTFTIPEVYFDLPYPGQFKRRIKGVRLTIPSVTGPYQNVSATLSLVRSWLRPTAQPGIPLVEVPPSRSVSIATSTAQNDAGVFELSFRDERYMPFEGLGAVSQWSLAMPKAFRQFDYQTINDVILSISYTAEQDGVLRTRVEAQNAALAGSIFNTFSNSPARRLFSLRQDFSSAFTRLARSASGTVVQVEITDRNFPLFLQGRNFQVQRAIVLLRTAAGLPPAGFTLTVDGTPVNAFPADPTMGKLPGAALPGGFGANLRGTHTFAITAAGNLAPAAPIPGDASAIDMTKLEDILIYVEYVLI